MPDKPVHIEIHVEELHLHYPESNIDDVADVSTIVGGKDGPQPPYDKRNKPIRGQVLKELSESDGATVDALCEILQANRTTVRNALHQFRDDYRAVSRLKEGGNTYYRLTEVGEKLLAKYEEQWSRGYKNLPKGFLEGFEVEA